MSSSGSTRSGDKSEPQSLGSGDKENLKIDLNKLNRKRVVLKVPLTLSESVLSRDPAASEYGDSEIDC